MTRGIRPILIAGFLTLIAGAAWAAASSVPANYAPDPGLRTASRAELETRVRRACANTQARIQNAAETTLARPCGCYASRIMRGLDVAELDAYRSTGYFNDTARGKALTAIDACGLRRPI
jgi:hypothetical protein